ncbi:MAG TPA: hypothetical protein VIK74_11750 [Parasegetibacter sp.]
METTTDRLKAQTNMNRRDLSHIRTIEDLRVEKNLTRVRIRANEEELKVRMKHLPAELVGSALTAVVPSFLSGKITFSAIKGVKSLLNNLLSKDKSGSIGSVLGATVKRVGMLSALNTGFRMLIKRLKK